MRIETGRLKNEGKGCLRKVYGGTKKAFKTVWNKRDEHVFAQDGKYYLCGIVEF